MSTVSLTGRVDPLTKAEGVPPLPRHALLDFGATLVVGPDPDDDPNGFRLTPKILAHVTRPWELFLEQAP